VWPFIERAFEVFFLHLLTISAKAETTTKNSGGRNYNPALFRKLVSENDSSYAFV
jgi:hypothetical protein